MILRKPYGFLIKHFKLIHLLITAIYIYLLVKVNSILRYYNDYLEGTANRLNAIKITTNYYLIAIILSIILCIIIYALMRYKKKPKLLYFVLIILYVLIALVINISYDGLNQIYIFNSLELKTARLYRDILRIASLFQYISIAFTLVRGLGFDIKKFNFKEDIADLGLNLDDEEEVELTLGSNEGIFRRIRRKIREYTYYYKENKLILVAIIATIVIVLSIILFLDKKVVNKIYNENETVQTDSFNLDVTNTYITSKSSTNKILTEEDETYVIVKMYITPYTRGSRLNTGYIVLEIGKEKYKLTEKNNNNFKDIGTIYTNQSLTSGAVYIFTFKVPTKNINKNMRLIYLEKTKINLSPINLDTEEKTKEIKLKENLNLNETILSNGNINISSIEIKDTFTHDFKYQVEGKDFTSKLNIKSLSNTLINIKLTYSLPNKMTIYELLENYGKIKYIIDNKEYTSNLMNNKTPGIYTEGLFLEVDKDIEKASKIWIELKIRNRKYTYIIK